MYFWECDRCRQPAILTFQCCCVRANKTGGVKEGGLVQGEPLRLPPHNTNPSAWGGGCRPTQITNAGSWSSPKQLFLSSPGCPFAAWQPPLPYNTTPRFHSLQMLVWQNRSRFHAGTRGRFGRQGTGYICILWPGLGMACARAYN